MAQKFVGIDLGNRKVKIAVVTAGLRGTQVAHVWEQEVRPSSRREPNDDAKLEAVDAAIDTALRMISERGLGHLPTGVALPGGAGSYRVLSFPFDDARQIAQTIGFELDGQFPLPLEELVTDHITIKRGDGKGRALVVAARRSLIEHVSARLKLADIDLKVITTGALAIAQAFASTPVPSLPAGASADLQPVVLVIDIGYKGTELVAIGPDGPIAARSMRRGGRALLRELKKAWRLDDDAAAAALERDGSVDDPLVRRALQPVLREIENTRQWLKADFGCQLVELRLAGGPTHIRGLDRWLATEVGVEVGSATPRESGVLRGVGGRDWTGSIVALGTAIATGRRPLVQLHDAFTGSAEGAWFQQHFSTVAALGIAIVAFAGVDTFVRIKAAERERDAYLSELETESLRYFDTSLSDKAGVTAKLGELEGGGQAEGGIPERGALEMLEIITKVGTPKGPPPALTGGALPPGYSQQTTSDGQVIVVDPSGQPVPTDPSGNPILPAVDPATGAPLGGPPAEPGVEGEGEPVALPPVDPKAGVVHDDQLLISTIEIRELKVELSVSATRATTQDRLAVQLEKYACINKVQPGMVRDRNDRKAFDMSIDHSCYTGSIAIDGGGETSEDGDG